PSAASTSSSATPVAARAPARAPGELAVVTPGTWASVTIGDRVLQTPCQVSLPPGRHDVSVVLGGRGTARRQVVTIRPGQVTRLVISE
ncbi:MAG: PEGA domain-containing protein, partial [Deltaproteobacteria bacterium]|nr:PEGA domain-containing protein [Deltaproteobacteria bacterium]